MFTCCVCVRWCRVFFLAFSLKTAAKNNAMGAVRVNQNKLWTGQLNNKLTLTIKHAGTLFPSHFLHCYYIKKSLRTKVLQICSKVTWLKKKKMFDLKNLNRKSWYLVESWFYMTHISISSSGCHLLLSLYAWLLHLSEILRGLRQGGSRSSPRLKGEN